MFCPNCGKENADTAQECLRCHVPLHDEEPAPAAGEEHHAPPARAPAHDEGAQAASDAAAASSEDLGEVCRRCETYNPPGTRRCTSCGLKLIADAEPEARAHSGSPSLSHAAHEDLGSDPGGEEKTPPTGLRADFGADVQDHTRAEPPPPFASDTPMEGHPSLSDELSALALSDEDARDAMGDARAQPPQDATPPDGMAPLSHPPPPTPAPPVKPSRAKDPAPLPHAEPEAPKAVAKRPSPPPPAPPGAAAPVATPPPPVAPAPPPQISAAPSEKHCASCAAPHPLNAKFCAECGTPFPKTGAAKPAPVAAAPPAPAPVPAQPPPRPTPPAPTRAAAATPSAALGNEDLSTDPSSKRFKRAPALDRTAEQPAVVIADDAPHSDTNADFGTVEAAPEEEPAFAEAAPQPEAALVEVAAEVAPPPPPEEAEFVADEVAPPPGHEEVEQVLESEQVTPAQGEHVLGQGLGDEGEEPTAVEGAPGYAEGAAGVEVLAEEAPAEAFEEVPAAEAVAEAAPLALPPYQVSVVVEKGPSTGTAFVLGHLENTLGGAGAAVELTEDPHLAPTHASLLFDDQRLLLRDEGAANGVFVRLKEPALLQPGDLFIAGERLLRFDGPIELPLGEETDTPFQGAPRPPGGIVRVTEVLLGGKTGRTCHRSGPTIAVGKAGCDLNFPADGLLAPRHAEIHLAEDGSATLVDVGGLGVLLRLRPQATHQLAAGDVLQVGDQVLRIEVG